MNMIEVNLTLARVEKADHGSYVCQASNQYTTTNISTLLLVESELPLSGEKKKQLDVQLFEAVDFFLLSLLS